MLSDETGELFASQPQSPALRFPLYKARVAPDIYFIGFDFTLDEARGDPRLDETAAARAMVGDNLGWFFVLQEAVGEPRFGLDTDAPIEPSAEKWDNLAWADIDLGSGRAVDVSKPFLAEPAGVDPAGVGVGEQRRRHGVHPLSGAGHDRGAWPQHAQEPQARGVAHG